MQSSRSFRRRGYTDFVELAQVLRSTDRKIRDQIRRRLQRIGVSASVCAVNPRGVVSEEKKKVSDTFLADWVKEPHGDTALALYKHRITIVSPYRALLVRGN